MIATTNETHLFNKYLSSAFDSWDLFDGRTVGLSQLMSKSDFMAWLHQLPDSYLERVARQKQGARIVVEKTPGHGGRAAEILRFYPESYFIHVIRDPRAVVTSMRAASTSWGAAWAPRRVKDACRLWIDRVAQALTIPALTTRYREVTYERLHAEGADELLRLFEWMGEPIERDEAERYVSAASFDKMRPNAATPLKAKKVNKQFFRRGEVDSWRTELSPTEIAIVERLTRKQMTKLGYEPISARSARLAAESRLQVYRGANKFAKAVRAVADRVKP